MRDQHLRKVLTEYETHFNTHLLKVLRQFKTFCNKHPAPSGHRQCPTAPAGAPLITARARSLASTYEHADASAKSSNRFLHARGSPMTTHLSPQPFDKFFESVASAKYE